MRGWKGRLAVLACVCLLAGLLAGFARAESDGKASNITTKCAFKLSEGTKDKLIDGKPGSVWSYKHKDAYVGVKLPKNTEAGWLRVEWFFDPTAYELIEYDADMNPIRQRDQSVTFPNIYSLFDLLPQTRYIQLKLNAKNQSIVNMQVYSAGTLPKDVQKWEPPVDKADIMFVSTHQDDELIFFGGAIPYYAVALQKPTVVVYMTNCARYRRAEALNALWKMGVRDYCDFINLKDEKVGSIEACVNLWGGKDNILSLVVARIRRYKPEVIVTQDLDGEYGHNQHKTTARCMMYAIEAAVDPEQYPESAEVYGAWQVKKLYHHLYKENKIEMDWETPMDSLGGKTPLEVAQIGMKEHSSQTQAYAVKSHGTYDNSKFGLYFTTVGEDVAKNDFLENIDPNASASWVAEHAQEIAAYPVWPEPSEADDEAEPEADADIKAEAAPDGEAIGEGDAADQTADAFADVVEDAVPAEPEPAVESEPQAEPEPPAATEPQPAKPASQSTGKGLATAAIALGVAAFGAGGWYAWRMRQTRRRHRRRWRR